MDIKLSRWCCVDFDATTYEFGMTGNQKFYEFLGDRFDDALAVYFPPADMKLIQQYTESGDESYFRINALDKTGKQIESVAQIRKMVGNRAMLRFISIFYCAELVDQLQQDQLNNKCIMEAYGDYYFHYVAKEDRFLLYTVHPQRKCLLECTSEEAVGFFMKNGKGDNERKIRGTFSLMQQGIGFFMMIADGDLTEGREDIATSLMKGISYKDELGDVYATGFIHTTVVSREEVKQNTPNF